MLQINEMNDSTMNQLAVVFPGQGSQSVGMLDAWGDHPEVVRTLDEANQVLGRDIRSLIQHGPKEQLDLTTNTQVVMLVAGVCCYRAFIAETNLRPVALAGHSLGEYSALVASGALDFAEALPLVQVRAKAMQEAVPVGVGAMAAILGLEAELVRETCLQVAQASGEVVEAVNFNDTKQTVIAGTKNGVDAACLKLKEAGAKRTLLLPVSAPFHSSLMKPAAEVLKEKLAKTKFIIPAIPVLNNIDVQVCEDARDIRDALYRQAFGPVRWVELVHSLRSRGVSHVLECGPGKVLTGMIKRIEPALNAAPLFDPLTLQEAKEMLA